ncbi:FAD/NAD-P-binding domain-containing protein, partial [Mycena epipterygia]
TIRIDFSVIGAGVAGLSCAIALRRIGHRVTVVEKNHDMADIEVSSLRMPPNLTKILFHWGLQDELHAIAVKCEALHLLRGDSGELLGSQIWDQELLEETRGEYLCAHLSDLMRLLYDEAIKQGVEFRLGTTAVSIDPEQGTITMDSGDVLEVDVIVGADGIAGLTRQILLQEEDIDEPADHQSMWMYSATIPKDDILSDRDAKRLYDEPHRTLFTWMRPGRSVYGFSIGGADEFAISAYGPCDDECSLLDGIRENLGGTEPRLKNLLPLLGSLRRHPVIKCEPLQDWVSASGRLVLIGSAAHPIPPGSLQEGGMAVEDGAVLARLFSHLHTRAQIGQFLWAFQEIRQPRCAAATQSEVNIMYYICMPDGEDQEARDNGLRAKTSAGIEAFKAANDQEETPEWQEAKEVYGYDAEDEADNWWVGWGSLKFRSERRTTIDFGSVQVTSVTD